MLLEKGSTLRIDILTRFPIKLQNVSFMPNLGAILDLRPVAAGIFVFCTFFGQFVFIMIQLKDLGGALRNRKRSP